MQIDLKKLLMQFDCPSEEIIHEMRVSKSVLSFLQLRDFLIRSGRILHEDSDNNLYVASLRAGLCGINRVIVATQFHLGKLYIAGYANEGIINQNSTKQALDKIVNAAKGINTKSTSKIDPKKLSFAVLIIVTLSIVGGKIFIDEVKDTISATKGYNEAVAIYNAKADEYNSIVEFTCVDNISNFPAAFDTLKTESELLWDNVNVVLGSNSKRKILADTQTIYDMVGQVEMAMAIAHQITAPSEEWVCERLRSVELVTDYQAVTEDLNPDGLLGKDGGYSACIYFTVTEIDPDEVDGDSIVAKGTDAGGAVEIYPTLADAEARCEYLAGFDNTILYSGSYALVGTMVIRISYKLSNEQQLELTSAITEALTAR